MFISAAILLFAGQCFSTLSAADDAAPAAPVGFWDQPNLLSGDARKALNDSGWSPFGTLYGEMWGNVQGGIRNGWTHVLLLNAGVEADMQKLAGWDGATLRASFEWLQSTHPDHNTGAFNEPTSADASDQIRLYNLYLRQKLSDDQLLLKVGQIGVDDDFAQCPAAAVFINPGVTMQPVIANQVLTNGDPSIPHFPLDAPGMFARFDPKGCPVYSQAGVYLSDAGPDGSNNHGFDWKTGNSVMVAGETGGNYSIAHLPGSAAVGVFYNDGQFVNWDSGAFQRGIYGAYAYISQALYQTPGEKGGDATPVLTAFLFGGWAGPDSLCNADGDCASGLDWNGPIPSRPQDVAGVAVLYTGFSPAYTRSALNPNGAGANPAGETSLEFTYQAALAPWLSLQPDVRVIFNPANAGKRDTAVVIGARAAIAF
jgi:porin